MFFTKEPNCQKTINLKRYFKKKALNELIIFRLNMRVGSVNVLLLDRTKVKDLLIKFYRELQNW